MRTNAAALDLIKRSEALRLHAYLCPAGVPTIGYGHTGDVELSDIITEHQADVILAHDVEHTERGVAELVAGIPLTENQFSALVSFAFNLGVTALRGSTLLRKLRSHDFTGAAAEFGKWTKALDPHTHEYRVLPGLVKRRAEEAALFLTPETTA
jgi:lysozyme